MLDAEKAFDSAWKEGLMFKLFDIGLRGKIWKMIYNSYENFECMVLVNGVLSDPFDVERGVHQGAPLSMRLYQIFTNDLLKELNEHVMTLKVYQHKIGSPAFADDVVVTAKSKRTMNILLEVALTHAHKCKDVSDEKEIIDKRAATVTQTLNIFLSLGGSKNPIIPSLSSKFYKAVCVPKMMYGSESCDVAQKNINILEKVQVESACRIQRPSRNIAKPVPLANIGWLSVTPLLHISQLVMLYRVLLLPSNNLIRQVVVTRVISLMYNQELVPPPKKKTVDQFITPC